MSAQNHNINRYRTAQGVEGECQPGSRGRVLRNKLGLRSLRAIERAEYHAMVLAQQAYIDRITTDTVFTAALICEMHRDWLGGIYGWAGAYRTVEMEKGGFRWPPARLVAQNMAAVERDTLRKHTPCRPAALVDIALRLAEVQTELLFVHPFREGNGRIARWVTDLLANQAGLPPLDYAFTGPGFGLRRQRYLEAVVLGYRKNYLPLAGFLAEALERRLGRPVR